MRDHNRNTVAPRRAGCHDRTSRRRRDGDHHRGGDGDHDGDGGDDDVDCGDLLPRDSGQAAVVVVTVAAALLVVFLTAVASLGRTSIERARAQTAADAAALASVVGSASDAVELAAAHDAVVVAWTNGPGPDEVTVTVRIGDVTATARATDAP